MQKRITLWIAAAAAVLMAAALPIFGCGFPHPDAESGQTVNVTTDNGGTTEAETEEQTEELSEEESAEDENIETEEAAYEETLPEKVTLPPYVYAGKDPYQAAIGDYVIREYLRYESANDPDMPEVYIPFSVIVEKNDTNPDDIAVYGYFCLDGYKLRNTTLTAVHGSRWPGEIHLKWVADGKLEVIRAELPHMGEEQRKLFEPIPGLYDRILAVSQEEKEAARAAEIATYVNANWLNVTQWQDYGRAPVPVSDAPETPEKDQIYRYESPIGYQLTYDLRELALSNIGEEDLFRIVNDSVSGTYLAVRAFEGISPDRAIKNVATDFTDYVQLSDGMLGNGIPCRKGVGEETLFDGRSFRFVEYAIPTGGRVITILMCTMYEEGVSEMTTEDLEEFFAPTLETLHVG